MNASRPRVRPLPRVPREQGMALFIALIVLLVVSILGVAAMRSALFQSRVSINSQTENLAFQAAESGLNSAFSEARRQIRAGILPGDAAHIFTKGANMVPQRVCAERDAGGNVVIKVYSDGVRDANGAANYVTPCPVLPDANMAVTTVVGPDPDGGESTALENSDASQQGAQVIEVRAYGEVPNTNVRSVHAQQWGAQGPSTTTEGG